jgi:hypothetical protein
MFAILRGDINKLEPYQFETALKAANWALLQVWGATAIPWGVINLTTGEFVNFPALHSTFN